MTQIVINRIEEDQYQTLGELEVWVDNEKVFQCKTLELPWKNNERNISRIPSNHYSAIKHQSPKFGDSLWLQNVQDRSEILIHFGNFRYDTKGCILVGKDFVDINGDGHLDLTSSKKTMSELYRVVKEPIFVNILDSV